MNPQQHAAFSQVIARSACHATERLRELTGQNAELTPPTIAMLTPEQAREEIAAAAAGWGSSVQIEFQGTISGIASVVYNCDEAERLAAEFARVYELDESEVDPSETLTEFANILINLYLGSLSNALGIHLNYRPPQFQQDLQAGFLLPDHGGNENTVFLGISTSMLLQDGAHQASLVLVLGLPSLVVLSAVSSRLAITSAAGA